MCRSYIFYLRISFIVIVVTKAGHGMTIASTRMTWLESFSYCRLATEDSIRYLTDGEYRGWAGGIFLNSQWMVHKGAHVLVYNVSILCCQGCYSNYGASNSTGVYDIKRLTPALCSQKCKMIQYFALKHNWCLCLHFLYNLSEVDSSKCTHKCSGSNNDVCGERSHYTVYQHILGELQPKRDVDQKIACTVIVPGNDTFVLKAANCFLEYWTACVIHGVTKETKYTDYQSAIRSCSSLNGRILSTTDNVDKLEDGREYWSDIFRSSFLKWITNETFDEICDEVNGLLNVDCLHLTVKYREIKNIPLPCKYKYPAICKSTQLGDSIVTKQCPTNNDTTTITSDQTEPEHRYTTANKPTFSTETEFLTSSPATMSTHLVSTTLDHTTIIPSSPKTMSTKFISSKHSFVWSRLSTVSASQSDTSIRDTTVGNRMELITSDEQMNNTDRTVANEAKNNGLVYSIIFSLVPVAAALAILIIMAVLITVVRRRRREKAHQERNGLQIEPGAKQPMIAYEKKSHGNQRNHLKTQDRGNPDYQIYSKVDDQYQHLDGDVRRKEPECFEAEYGYAMATTSFLKPDKENQSSNGALKVAIAKRAKVLRTSLHFLQGQFSKQKSDKENVAYCDTAIVHTKFLYDTPQQSMKHVNKP